MERSIFDVLRRLKNGETLDFYRAIIKNSVCSCELPVFNKDKKIDEKIITFYKSRGFFLNEKTNRFEEKETV